MNTTNRTSSSHNDNDNDQTHKKKGPKKTLTQDPPIRVLCLHDANSNASELYDILQPLDERLYHRHDIEFVYIDSPLCCRTMDNHQYYNKNNTTEQVLVEKQQQQQHSGAADHIQKRIWWEEDEGGRDNDDMTERTQQNEQNNSTNDGDAAISTTNITTSTRTESARIQRLGLDASLVHIRQVWNTMPFHGILAMGQGCAVASLLPFVLSNLDFAIMIHGQALLEEEELLIQGNSGDEWNCLHILEETHATQSSRRLVTQLGGEVHLSLAKTVTKEDYNAIGKFLVQEKKRLLRGSGPQKDENNKLILQSELHRVEQEASKVVAEQIRENPPKALMAIITPQSIGGWSGPKRRGPQDEGGGAPCPSEFLLNKEDRSKTGATVEDNGPGRQHPDSAGK